MTVAATITMPTAAGAAVLPTSVRAVGTAGATRTATRTAVAGALAATAEAAVARATAGVGVLHVLPPHLFFLSFFSFFFPFIYFY